VCIMRSYKTVSTAGLNVLSGVPPLDLVVAHEVSKRLFYKWNVITDISSDLHQFSGKCKKLKHGIRIGKEYKKFNYSKFLTQRSDKGYFTDGSKLNDKVECAWLRINQCNEIIENCQYRLNKEASVYTVEALAIEKAIFNALENNYKHIDIYADSRSVLDSIESLEIQDDIIERIKNILSHSESIVNFHWIKAHVGHYGNEMADLFHFFNFRIDLDIIFCKTYHSYSFSNRP